MTKRQFINALARKNGFNTGYSERILNAFLDSVEDALFRDGRVALPGFGVFSVHAAAEKNTRNPLNGETIKVAAHHKVTFKSASALKEMMN